MTPANQATAVPDWLRQAIWVGLCLPPVFAVNSIFYILTGLALVGVILTLLVPRAHREDDMRATPIEPNSIGRERHTRRLWCLRSAQRTGRPPPGKDCG